MAKCLNEESFRSNELNHEIKTLLVARNLLPFFFFLLHLFAVFNKRVWDTILGYSLV